MNFNKYNVILATWNMDKDGSWLINKRGGMPMESLRGSQGGNGLWVLIQTHIFEFYHHLGKPSIFVWVYEGQIIEDLS